MSKYINITYPFKDSKKGFFIDLTEVDADAIKSDLLHLLLTKKGERLYKPDFGTNLLRYIFEPHDGLTLEKIKGEITLTLKKYLSKLHVNDITVTPSSESEYAAVVRLDYTIEDDVFTKTDFVVINI